MENNTANAELADEMKNYSEEEIAELVRIEADKCIEKAVTLAKSEWEAELGARIEKECEEAVWLASMSSDERGTALQSKKERELIEKEHELMLKECVIFAKADLVKRNLPVSFADILACESSDVTAKNIELFDEAFRGAVAETVSDRLKGTTPSGGTEQLTVNQQYLNRYKQAGNIAERIKIKRDALEAGVVL